MALTLEQEAILNLFVETLLYGMSSCINSAMIYANLTFYLRGSLCYDGRCHPYIDVSIILRSLLTNTLSQSIMS